MNLSYEFNKIASGGTQTCTGDTSFTFRCSSNVGINTFIFSHPGLTSCDPITLFTGTGTGNRSFLWTEGVPPMNTISQSSSVVIDNPNWTNIQLVVYDSNFSTCEYGIDTLNTTVNYQGFESQITSSFNTEYDCSDPTTSLSFSDIFLVDSLSYLNHSYRWFKRVNGNSILIQGETNASLSEVDEDGQYAIEVRDTLTNCSDVSNYITVSGISDTLYTLAVDGGNAYCIGDESPELDFTPPLPFPFPAGATMTVFDDGISQGNDISINSEGIFNVDLTFAGGCRPKSNMLLVDLDTVLCDSGFVISPNNFICIEDPVAMISRGPNDPSISYHWSFPGGSPSTYTGYYPPLVNYGSSGSYTITMIMTSSSGVDTITKSITVADDCCKHTYSTNNASTFSFELGTVNDTMTYSGGGTFDGTYHVLGTIILKDGIYEVKDGTTFFVKPSCNRCDYLNNAEGCQSFQLSNYTQIIIENASLLMGDAEFRSECEEMWYGIAAIGDGAISTLNDSTGNNALIMDAFAGITICDPEGDYDLNYQLDQVSFINNIIGLEENDRSASTFGYVRQSHIDVDPSLMKSPYRNRYGMSGVAFDVRYHFSDFDQNFISNQNYGYYHSFLGDPNMSYHILDNTIRDFFVIGMALGGNAYFISEVIDNDFHFPASHIGSATSPISGYTGYEGFIPVYPNIDPWPSNLVSQPFNKDEVVGAALTGKLHFYRNNFYGNESRASAEKQSGLFIGAVFGAFPNDNSLSENLFTNFDAGVRHSFAASVLFNNEFRENKTGLLIPQSSTFNDYLLDQNTFMLNESGIEINDFADELSLQNNLFLDNDTSINVKHDNNANPLDMLMNCNKFQLDSTESYVRYGLFVHSGADIRDIGGDGDPGNPDPSGNGWPVVPTSPGYDSCVTPGTGIDLTQWSSPTNWVSIVDSSSSIWKYYAYHNEFTGTFSPSSILDPQPPGVLATGCAVQSICFPLASIIAKLDIDEKSKQLVIYPNPSKDRIQIQSSEEKIIELVRIYDVALSNSPIELYQTGKQIEINISQLASGLYVLEVWNKDGSRDFARLIKE